MVVIYAVCIIAIDDMANLSDWDYHLLEHNESIWVIPGTVED